MPQRGIDPKTQEPNALYFTKSTTLPGWCCTVCPLTDGHPAVLSHHQALQHERSRAHIRAAEAFCPWNNQPVIDENWNPPDQDAKAFQHFRDEERRNWVDRGADVIGFWRRGVEAAIERGEEPESMQTFLERLEEDKEGRRQSDDWGSQGPSNDGGWGNAAKIPMAGWNDWAAAPPADDWANDWNLPPVNDWASPSANDWGNGWTRPGRGWGKSGRKERPESPSKNLQVWRHPHGSGDSSSRLQGSENSIPEAPEDMDSFVERYAWKRAASPAEKERRQTFLKMPLDEKANKIQELARSLRALS